MCGKQAEYAWNKPFCPACYWNVAAARRYLLRQMWTPPLIVAVLVLIFVLASKYGWAGLGISIGIPNYVAMIRGWRKVRGLPEVEPHDLPLPPSPREAPSLGRASLLTSVSGMIIVAVVGGVLAYLGHLFADDIRAALNRQWITSHLMISLLAGFMMFVLAGMGRALVRSWRIENAIAAAPAVAMGRVTRQDPGNSAVSYRFQTATGELIHGKGTVSEPLFEQMPILILYAQNAPEKNVPASGLEFFELANAARLATA